MIPDGKKLGLSQRGTVPTNNSVLTVCKNLRKLFKRLQDNLLSGDAIVFIWSGEQFNNNILIFESVINDIHLMLKYSLRFQRKNHRILCVNKNDAETCNTEAANDVRSIVDNLLG